MHHHRSLVPYYLSKISFGSTHRHRPPSDRMVRPAPYKHRIVNAILELNEYRGSSLKSIETAVIQGHVGISNLVYIKNALKKGVATGDFIKVVDAISKYKLSPKLFAQAMARSKKSHSQSQKSIKDEEGVEESDFRAYLLGLTMHDLCYKTTAKKVFFLEDSDLSTLPIWRTGCMGRNDGKEARE